MQWYGVSDGGKKKTMKCKDDQRDITATVLVNREWEPDSLPKGYEELKLTGWLTIVLLVQRSGMRKAWRHSKELCGNLRGWAVALVNPNPRATFYYDPRAMLVLPLSTLPFPSLSFYRADLQDALPEHIRWIQALENTLEFCSDFYTYWEVVAYRNRISQGRMMYVVPFLSDRERH